MIRDKIENERKNKIEVKVCIFSNVLIYITLFTFYSMLLCTFCNFIFLFICLKFFQKLPTVNKELAQKLQEMKGSAKYKVIFNIYIST